MACEVLEERCEKLVVYRGAGNGRTALAWVPEDVCAVRPYSFCLGEGRLARGSVGKMEDNSIFSYIFF